MTLPHDGAPVRRSWPARHKVLTGLLVLVALFVVFGALSGGQQPTQPASAVPTVAPSTSPAVKSPANPLADKGWVVASYILKDDGTGNLGGSARVTNTASTARDLLGKLTVFKAGAQVGNLDLAAQGVAPGQTVTVDLVGTDKYTPGPYAVQFQASF